MRASPALSMTVVVGAGSVATVARLDLWTGEPAGPRPRIEKATCPTPVDVVPPGRLRS